jgi:hypothetical protein
MGGPNPGPPYVLFLEPFGNTYGGCNETTCPNIMVDYGGDIKTGTNAGDPCIIDTPFSDEFGSWRVERPVECQPPKKEKLTPSIGITIGSGTFTIHTSCSQPLWIGQCFGPPTAGSNYEDDQDQCGSKNCDATNDVLKVAGYCNSDKDSTKYTQCGPVCNEFNYQSLSTQCIGGLLDC